METEHDDIVLECWKLSNGILIVKLKKHDGLDGDNYVKHPLPSHLGAFILSNSKRNMNKFIGDKTDFIIIVYTTETRIICR